MELLEQQYISFKFRDDIPGRIWEDCGGLLMGVIEMRRDYWGPSSRDPR
jgi:hypothetical protein